MAIIDFSVRKTQSLVKLITAALLFIVGLAALLVGTAPRVNIAKDGGGISGPDVAHADAPYAQGDYYSQASYGGGGCGDGCGDGDGDGDGGSSQ